MKTLKLATALVLSCAAANTAEAAVVINVTQVGSGVNVAASGSFDRALSTRTSGFTGFGQIIAPSSTYISVGNNGPVTGYNLSGTDSFGFGSRSSYSTNNGIGMFFNVSGRIFAISDTYIDNNTISSLSTVNNATLDSLGLVAGTYNYAVGGNTVSLNIGSAITAAVPEPSTWAMMLVGFGMIGATSRYRRKGVQVRYA